MPRADFVKWFAHQSGMGPYYDAPMVDEDRTVDLAALHHRRIHRHGAHVHPRRSGTAEPFWLSLNFTAPHYPWIDSHPKRFTDLYADCAFDSCPDEPPHP